jgi:predicted AAA+ superfamily ATPase
MKTYIPRSRYLERIEPFIGKDLIKIITGQRRVGKSYLLFQIIDTIKAAQRNANILYINKELDEFAHLSTYKDLLTYVEQIPKNSEKLVLVIDEIQDIAEFEKALRGLLAQGGYDIYCSGSNAALLSGELSTYLSGRYVEFQIYGLSFNEFMQFHQLPKTEETLMKYIKFGGLPYLIHLELEESIVFEYLKNIHNSIVLRDVVARYQIRNVFLLENLLLFLADNLANLLSAKRISDFLKSQRIDVLPKIILNYLYYLTNAFYIYKVPRMNISGRKIFEINDKYYFEDLGLRHTLRKFVGKDINKVLENLVFKHLLNCQFTVYVGQLGENEIDFVAERKDTCIYVQVAYVLTDPQTHEREFGNLLKITDNFPKYVVSMDKFAGETYKGIHHQHIIEFLSNEF